jgi:carbon-monoxide dehydrogenase medium subunit
VRYAGTLGGNVANGDPGNDMPAVMLCLGASYHDGQGRRAAHRGARVLPGRLFHRAGAGRDRHRDPHSAAPGRHGYAYQKLKRKIGDYATAAAAVVLTVDGSGSIGSCSIGLTNVAETPLWAEDAAKILVGTKLDAATVKKAMAAAEAITSPASDRRGTPQYRTKMAGVMLARALARAKERARA